MFYMNKFEYSKDKSIICSGIKSVSRMKKDNPYKLIQKLLIKFLNLKKN